MIVISREYLPVLLDIYLLLFDDMSAYMREATCTAYRYMHSGMHTRIARLGRD